MDTNAILCLALTVISNFSRSVPIADDSFPKGAEDVRVFTIGRPYFPLDLYLRDKRGDQFWIRRGAVAIYLTPESYFTLQDPKLIPNFVGSATLNSNEVRRMALTSMQNLSPTQFLGGVEPVFKIAKPYRRKEIPFYEVRWPDP